jgi:hypothetical protein
MSSRNRAGARMGFRADLGSKLNVCPLSSSHGSCKKCLFPGSEQSHSGLKIYALRSMSSIEVEEESSRSKGYRSSMYVSLQATFC